MKQGLGGLGILALAGVMTLGVLMALMGAEARQFGDTEGWWLALVATVGLPAAGIVALLSGMQRDFDGTRRDRPR